MKACGRDSHLFWMTLTCGLYSVFRGLLKGLMVTPPKHTHPKKTKKAEEKNSDSKKGAAFNVILLLVLLAWGLQHGGYRRGMDPLLGLRERVFQSLLSGGGGGGGWTSGFWSLHGRLCVHNVCSVLSWLWSAVGALGLWPRPGHLWPPITVIEVASCGLPSLL